MARSNRCEFYSREREGELAIECRGRLAVVLLEWLSKKVFINLGVWLTRAIPLSDGKTTSSCSMNRRTSRTVYDLFRKMNSQNRNEYLRYFSLTKWKALPETQKSGHSMSNCEACQVHHFAMQSIFPHAAKLKPQKLVRDGLVQNESNGEVNVKPTQKAITSATKHIYSKINVSFQKVFKVSFAETQTKVKELKLQKKKDAIEKRLSGPKGIVTWCLQQGSPFPRGQSKGSCFTSSQPQTLPSGCKNTRTRKILARENVSAIRLQQHQLNLTKKIFWKKYERRKMVKR